MPKSMSLILSLFVDHDVFRLQVAVDDTIGMDVVEGLENANGDADGAVLGMRPSSRMCAQQAAFAPLHHHVNAGTVFCH